MEQEDEIKQEKLELAFERTKIINSINKSKSDLIRELKGDLGTEIKQNPKKIIIHKKSLLAKILDGFKTFLRKI